MKPIVGIIERNSLSESNLEIGIVYKHLEECLIKSGAIPIVISNKNIDIYLEICSGFILQGGSIIDKNNLLIIKKLHKLNIPLLGICLGMQEMGIAYSAEDYDLSNHKELEHEIFIENDTLLKKIINKDKIIVNSRHKSAIKNTSLNISAIANNQIIEAIEDKDKLFFLGLQWHPEDLYSLNSDSKLIFDYFVNMCQNYKYINLTSR